RGSLLRIDPDLVNKQRVCRAVGGVLTEHDVIYVARLEGMNGRSGKSGQRNFYLHPTAAWNCPAERSEFERVRKISSIILQTNERQVSCRDLLAGETPQEKRVAQKVDLPVAESYHPDFRVPTAVLRRLPVQAQRIRRRIEVLSLYGHFAVHKFERAGRRSLAATIKVGIACNAVVEEAVPVIVGVSKGRAGGPENRRHEKGKTRAK